MRLDSSLLRHRDHHPECRFYLNLNVPENLKRLPKCLVAREFRMENREKLKFRFLKWPKDWKKEFRLIAFRHPNRLRNERLHCPIRFFWCCPFFKFEIYNFTLVECKC